MLTFVDDAHRRRVDRYRGAGGGVGPSAVPGARQPAGARTGVVAQRARARTRQRQTVPRRRRLSGRRRLIATLATSSLHLHAAQHCSQWRITVFRALGRDKLRA